MQQWFGKLSNCIEKKNTKWVDILIVLAYTIFHFVIFSKHEPFYDEAIAWNIARRATIKDILFYIPHYEGHPPLWHLVLAVFAKSGMPYELSLSIVSYLFTVAAIVVLFKYSPFPKPVNWALPFTYFFFFQYGITTRPYCMMILAFVLCGAFYKERNTKPGRYVAALLFLCLTTAYGIAVAGGIAFSWVVEICCEKKLSLKQLMRDRRTWWLSGLLVAAIMLIYLVTPMEQVNAVSNVGDYGQNLLKRLIVLFLVVPSDLFFTNVVNDYVGVASFVSDSLQFRVAVLISILIWCGVVYFGWRRKTLLLGVIPYTLFGVFSSVVYFYLHHLGIGFFIFLFWLWCTCTAQDVRKAPFDWKPAMKKMGTVAAVISCMILLGWNAKACVLEWNNYCALGKNQADFIKEHRLEEYQMMVGWNISNGEVNTRAHFVAECVLPYFQHNIFYNYNDGTDEKGYLLNRKPSEAEMQQDIQDLINAGKPDVLYQVDQYQWSRVFLQEEYGEYRNVYMGVCDRVWKNTLIPFYRSFIRVREDLLEETGLQDVSVMVRN